MVVFIALGIWILLGIIGMALVGIYDYYNLGATEYTIKDLFLCIAGPIILIFIIFEVIKEKGDVVIFRRERKAKEE
jgi:hypothetical protein